MRKDSTAPHLLGPLRRFLLRWTRRPPVGGVDMGELRRLTPISDSWGFDRGLPVDRYYMERFLGSHAEDVAGRVLEFGDNGYTVRFGGARVTQSDVFGVAGDRKATVTGDLLGQHSAAVSAFDCVICTQTIQVLPDPEAALSALHQLIQPGGVLLLTVPGISKIYEDSSGRWSDHWHFTDRGLRQLGGRVFGEDAITVQHFGNVLSASAFLFGLAAEELTTDELDQRDPRYQVLVALRGKRKL